MQVLCPFWDAKHMNSRIFPFCLFLQVTNGVPQLEVGPYKLQLNKITVSDGNWHLFDVIITQK